MKILLTGAFRFEESQKKELESLGFEATYVEDEKKELDLDVSDFDAVVCNYLFLYNDISKFEKLKYIQLTSSGIDCLPADYLDYIQIKGIQVFKAKGAYSIPVAEWAVMKILELYKKSKEFYRMQASHEWKKVRGLEELYGKHVAIIGYGGIGKEIAKRLKGFGVKVHAVNRNLVESKFIEDCHLFSEVDSVLKASDIVISTIPSYQETYHFFNGERFALMKDGCVFINVSRKKVVDEQALVEQLKAGKFLGVFLDVYETESIAGDSVLWDYENVIVTPHKSFTSRKVNERIFEIIRANLKSVAQGR